MGRSGDRSWGTGLEGSPGALSIYQTALDSAGFTQNDLFFSASIREQMIRRYEQI